MMELSGKDVERLEEAGYWISLIRDAESMGRGPWDAIFILLCISQMKVLWLMNYVQWERRFQNKN